MADADIYLWPLFAEARGDMLIHPFYPTTATPHYISLDQMREFVGAGTPGPAGPEGPPGATGPAGPAGAPGSGTLGGMTAGQIPIASGAAAINSSANLSGDVTSNATLATTITANAVTTTKIAAGNVTYAKIQNVAAARLLGNSTGSAAAPGEISLGTNLSFSGTVLNATGGGGGLSGMTAGQLPVAATATTVTSSIPLPLSLGNGGTGINAASNAALLTGIGALPLAGGTLTGATTLSYSSATLTITDTRAVAVGNGGRLQLSAANNSGVTPYAAILGYAVTSGAGTEDGALIFQTKKAGTLTNAGNFDQNGRLTVFGDITTPTLAAGNNSTSVATTAFVARDFAPLANPTFTGAIRTAAYIYFGGATGTVNSTGGSFVYGDGNYVVAHTGSTGVFQVQNNTGVVSLSINQLHEVNFAGGVVCGNPVGLSKGAGTLNAVTVYGNNVVLTSDAGLKHDIGPLPCCLDLIRDIEPKSYRWKPLPESGTVPTVEISDRHNWGFLAQDVAKATGAHRIDDGIEGVDLGGLVATLWQAVRELSAKVEALESAR